MARSVLLDEFHLTVFVPRRFPAAASAAVRRALDSRLFRAELRRAVADVFRRHPSLAIARFTVTR